MSDAELEQRVDALDVYARVSPADKLRVVPVSLGDQAHQAFALMGVEIVSHKVPLAGVRIRG